MKKVDLLILNNCPSFYKINLYNEIDKLCSIHVVFIALTNQVVITDDYKSRIKFSYSVIEEIQIEKRNKFKSLYRLYKLCRHEYNYSKIIFGGYDSMEFLLLIFLLKKKRNVLQCESSIYESKIEGMIGLLKKIIISRFSIVMPSGTPHQELFESLKFKGKYVKTNGVGIFNYEQRIVDIYKPKLFNYIYVGRLIDKKNIQFLVDEFNDNGRSLSIIGTGELGSILKEKSKDNINYLGFIPNDELNKYYQKHDVFILPSLSEPWGLVVEEAIYWGLPVIVSDAVGSQVEMVKQPCTGIVFELNKKNSLIAAILEMESNYLFYKQNALNFDFSKRDEEQVNTYLKIIDL